MADAGIIEGEKLLIKIGDGGTPEVFAHPCLINTTRSLELTTNLTEIEVPDCATPSLPAKIVRKARSKDLQVSGEGTLDKTSVFPFLSWHDSQVAKNVQIVQNETGANGGWTYTVPMLLSSFRITGERGGFQTCQMTLVPAGVWTLAGNP